MRIILRANPLTTRHIVYFTEFFALLAQFVAIAICFYAILGCFCVPVRSELLERLVNETAVVQTGSHLIPKYRALGDSVKELVTVGRDTMAHRKKLSHLLPTYLRCFIPCALARCVCERKRIRGRAARYQIEKDGVDGDDDRIVKPAYGRLTCRCKENRSAKLLK